MLHISLAGEPIAYIGTFPITNSLLTTWIVMAALIGISLVVRSHLSKIPGTIQVAAELVIGALYDMFSGVLGKQVGRFFPLLASFFLFIIVSNWIGLLPGVGSIGVWEEHKEEAVHENTAQNSEEAVIDESDSHEQTAIGAGSNTSDDHGQDSYTAAEIQEVEPVQPDTVVSEEHTDSKEHSSEKKLIPLLRAPTADLNTTLGLALISFISLQYFGLRTLGMQYVKKFINFSNPINFYVGLLEIISEFGKIISFGFRLFGNIFAGEVLLTVIAFLVPLLAPIPFLGLEIFVGMIQALVFSMLTAVFLSTAISKEGH